MFASNKNIETIAALAEESKKWLALRARYAKFSAVDKIVRITSALVLTLVIALLTMLALIYLSFAAAYELGDMLGSCALGFLLVGAVYIIVLLVILIKRRAWIERPLVSFLVDVLTDEYEEGEDTVAEEEAI